MFGDRSTLSVSSDREYWSNYTGHPLEEAQRTYYINETRIFSGWVGGTQEVRLVKMTRGETLL